MRAVSNLRPSSVIRTSTLRRRCRSIPTTCRPSYASVIVGLPCLVETDASQLPASARSGGPLLHRITFGRDLRERGRVARLPTGLARRVHGVLRGLPGSGVGVCADGLEGELLEFGE